MQAGKKRYEVTIQTVSTSQNTFGEPVQTWSDTDSRYAAIEPLSGRELFSANQVQAGLSHKITMYYYDLKAKDRITYNGRTFNVKYVIHPEERKRHTIAYCEEQV